MAGIVGVGLGGRCTAETVVGVSLEGPCPFAVGLVVGDELRATLLQLFVVDPVDQLERLIEVVLRRAASMAVGGEVVAGKILFVVDLPGVGSIEVGDCPRFDPGRQLVEELGDDPGYAVGTVGRIEVGVVVLGVDRIVADVDIGDAHPAVGDERDVVLGPSGELSLVGLAVRIGKGDVLAEVRDLDLRQQRRQAAAADGDRICIRR